MTSAPVRALAAALASSLLLVAAPPAVASTPTRCATLHGRNLVAGGVIRVVRLKLPTIPPRGADSGSEHRTALFACELPNGRVHRLATAGASYFKGEEGTPVESSAVKIGTSAGRFVTVIETLGTLMGETFLTDRVLSAANGRRLYTYLRTSSASTQPSLLAPLRTLLNSAGALVGLFPVFDEGHQESERLIAYASSRGQVLDVAENGSIPAASITLTGDVVRWTDAGSLKTATIAPAT